MSYKLIVFDWDGTLMDSRVGIVAAIQGACRDLGLPVPSDSTASWVIGLSPQYALPRAVPTLTESMLPRFIERYHAHYLLHDPAPQLFDGVFPLLDELAERNVFLAVATGKSRAGLDHALVATGLRDRFAATRTADETHSKPHPAMLNALMAELNVAPEAVLMVGDTSHDLQMATNAGVHSVGVSYGAHDVNELSACAPQVLCHSVRELSDWLFARL